MSTIERIAVCQDPLGEGQYVPADVLDERCFMPGCGCTPKVYALEREGYGCLERIEQLEQALREAQANNDQMAYELGIHPDQQGGDQ